MSNDVSFALNLLIDQMRGRNLSETEIRFETIRFVVEHAEEEISWEEVALMYDTLADDGEL